MSVERARRIIEERTGLTLSETGPFQPEGRDAWLVEVVTIVTLALARFKVPDVQVALAERLL
jgi:hypothetical protein